jgi:SAM-dependent methyltransferase
MKPVSEVISFYETFPEESRLSVGPFRLELERTKEVLARVLPNPPGPVIDVGGAAGAYSAWLAGQGYEVHLLDISPRLVEEARKINRTLARPIASIDCADARSLPTGDCVAAAMLLMGPLYHLPEAADRFAALAEGLRVLAPSGTIVVAAISRYASALDGLARKLSLDPAFVGIRDRDLVDGQHRNETNHPDYFTTAYFHRPEDLRAELEQAGFQHVKVIGVEGPGWMLPDFEARWRDPALRHDLLAVARALECEPAIVGVSAHLLAFGRKPP